MNKDKKLQICADIKENLTVFIFYIEDWSIMIQSWNIKSDISKRMQSVVSLLAELESSM